jgi:parallel beta-helix repeat protein
MKAKLNYFSELLLSNICRLTINDMLGVESMQRLLRGITLVLMLFAIVPGSVKAATITVPGTYSTIQAAVNASLPGDVITVAAGTYTENVIVSKAVTINGAGAAATFIVATDANSYPLSFTATGATVNGFTLTHNYTPAEISAWNFNNNGVAFTSGSGNTLTNCTVTLSRNGIYINNSQNNIISNNIISNNRTGINTTGNINGTQITGNTISNNWTEGFVSYYLSNTANYSTVVITGNTFNSNWYSQIEIKDASASGGTLDVSNNTFSDSPVTYSISSNASLNEPGFASQIPNVPGIGGTATKPVNALPTLRIYNSGSVVLAYNHLKTVLVQSGETIQASLNIANAGDVVSVQPGTYAENLTISKSVTLQSISGAASTLISGSNPGSAAVSINSDNVTVNGFTISNPPGKYGIQATDHSHLTISENIINNVGSTDGSSSGTNFGIAVSSSAAAVDLIGIVDNTITNITGGGNRTAVGIEIGFTTGNFDITNLVIQDNTISNITSIYSPITSAKGAYGILLNHGTGLTGKTVNAIVKDNTISNLEGLWAHGIGLEGNTPNISVTGNNINHLVDHKTPSDAVAVQVEDNASAGTVNITSNSFSNVSVGVANLVPLITVNAINNYWGSATGPYNQTLNPSGTGVAVSDLVDFDPWTGKTTATVKIGWPKSGATVYSTTPSLSWYTTLAVNNGVTFDVYVRLSTDVYGGANSFIIPGVTSLSAAVPLADALTPGATYFYKVRMNFPSDGGSVDSYEESFVVDSHQGGAPLPVLSWPVGSATIYSTSPTLNWYLSDWSTASLTYQISLIDVTDGNTTVSGFPQSTSNLYFNLTAPLISGHMYKWNVTTINGSQNSGPTADEFFTIDSHQGNAPQPVLSWPVGGAMVNSTPRLSWYLSDWSAGTLTYAVTLTDVTNGNSVVSGFPQNTADSFLELANPLMPGHTYTWSVISINGVLSSAASTTETFTVYNGSESGFFSIPVVTSPTGNSTISLTNPEFNWTVDTPPSGTYSYTLEIKKQSIAFDGIPPATNSADNIIIQGISSNSYTLSGIALDAGTQYHWRVKLVSGPSSSAWSDVNGEALFTTAASSITLVSPVLGSPDKMLLSTSSPSLSWYLPTKPILEQSYRVEISVNSDLSNPFMQENNLDKLNSVAKNLVPGIYYWRVQAASADGKYSDYSKIGAFKISGTTAVNNEDGIPKEFAVSQNYPNPFNPSTLITYALPKTSMVSIKIYNMLGQEVKSLLNSERQPGVYTIQWNGDNNFGQHVASGVYIYRVTAGQNIKTMKMMLLK